MKNMGMVIDWINSIHYITMAALAGALILILWIYDKSIGDDD
jgi:hypothetical protein